MPEITAVVTCVVTINIEEQGDVFTRVTGPDGDDFRAATYGYIKTEDDVIGHWAHNAVANGYVDACQLDGWADINAEQVTFRVDDVQVDDVEWPEPVASKPNQESPDA